MDSASNASVVPPGTSRRQHRLYLLILILFPALFLGSSIPIVKSSSFPADSADPFLLNADYAFSLKHVDCDIVVFGDSTAVTGIDPTVVQQSTALKTCNIAQSQSIFEVVGPLALDTYLKNNIPPRYIVIQLSPETIARRDFFWYEGLTILVRRKPLYTSLAFMATHPTEAYRFALWALKARIAAMTGAQRTDFGNLQSIFRARHGLLVLPKPPETSCVRDTAYAPPEPGRIEELRRKYAVNGTRVLVNVSPIPTCTRNAAEVASAVANLTDNSLPLYPIGLFCDMDRHLTVDGAARLSLDVARQILSLRNQAQ